MKTFSFALLKKILIEYDLFIDTNIPSFSEEGSFNSIKINTRELQENDIFLALKGSHADGHRFIESAFSKKAACVLLEDQSYTPKSKPWVLVKNTRASWAVLFAKLYKNPQKNLHFYGVTGTDGKTSTVWMTFQILRNMKIKALSVGTLGIFHNDNFTHTDHTTPDPPTFYKKLKEAQEQSTENILMEVSSHSLVQEKLKPVSFDIAVFTSFSRDHLDFHKDLDSYWRAKLKLFTDHLKTTGKALVHHSLLERIQNENIPLSKIWTYGHDPLQKCSYKQHLPLLEALDTENGQKISFLYEGKQYSGSIPYSGIHNAENFLAAFFIAESITKEDFPPPEWKHLAEIPGRLERVASKERQPQVFVDFAHTPEALRTILTAMKKKKQKGKLWILIGCGGDRDSGKRPEMAQVASSLADEVVLTSDNPRTENPLKILADMKVGLKKESSSIIISNREEAIEYAICSAKKDDIILIAGKGHEDYQIIGHEKIDFSDQNFAKHFLEKYWRTP